MGIEPREHALQRILGKHIHLDRVNVVALDLLHDPSDEFEIAQGRGGGDRHQGNGSKTQYNANGNQLRSSHGPTLVPSFVSSPMRRLSALIGGAYRGAGCKGTGSPPRPAILRPETACSSRPPPPKPRPRRRTAKWPRRPPSHSVLARPMQVRRQSRQYVIAFPRHATGHCWRVPASASIRLAA